MKAKIVSVLAGVVLIFGLVSPAFALTPQVVHLSTTDNTGNPYTADVAAQSLNGSAVWLMGYDPTTGAPVTYLLNSGLILNGSISSGIGELDITNNIPSSDVQTLDNFKFDTNNSLSYLLSQVGSATSSISSLSSSITTLGSNVSSLTTSISSFSGSIASMNLLNLKINANLSGTSTDMTAQASSTIVNGLITKVQSNKLDAMSANLPWSWATSTRSIVTGTGATGYQVSSTRNSTVHYSLKVTTTASIAGNADGYITLEIAPTNSATTTDWVEMGRCGNSQALTLAITLQSVQGTTCEVVGDVPAGYYEKLRSVTTTGTVTFAFLSGQEVLK